MKKIIVQTKHKFTEAGRWGIGLFIASPFASGIATLVILSQDSDRYSDPPVGAIIFLGLTTLTFCLSIPLLLIGRTSLHIAETIEGSEKADEIWNEWSIRIDRP
ncbi:hypothetical protein ACRQ1B_06570 [Rhizobium panacihumi]|uniref:hypothetical protein n=1 Tax=Rhizobium panacihumi TaxID=2008450 RepID=UPI003D7A94E1